jgi:hypothetical protein
MAISAAELAALQAAVNATLDQSCQVQRNTPTTSNYATQTDSWATVATVNCHVGKPSANIAQQYADKVGALALWLVRLPVGTDVRVGDASHGSDQLIIGSKTLRVQAILTPRSYPVALVVIAAGVE